MPVENPMISVVVPAYNCAPWLPRCIDSILNQTYKHLEVIVVDDGSEDESLQILRAYEGRIRVLVQKNSGVTAARLAGVRAAAGEFIGFVDADDEIEPQMYENLYKNAERFQADISHCSHQVVQADGRTFFPHNTGKLWQQDRIRGIRELLEDVYVEQSLCTKLFKRTLFEGLEESLDPSIQNNEDMLMTYRLFSRARQSVFQDVCPYHYLLREKSASRGHISRHTISDPIAVRRIILEDCPQELKNTARQALLRSILLSCRSLCLQDRNAYREDEINLRKILKKESYAAENLPQKLKIQIFTVRFAPEL